VAAPYDGVGIRALGMQTAAGLRRRGFVLATLASPALRAQPVVLRIGRFEHDSPLSLAQERVIGDAFSQLGLRWIPVRLPGRRIIEMANEGELDADLGRIADIAKRYTNLVLVPAPVARVDIAVYGLAPDFAERTRQEIASMHVGIEAGVFVLAKHTTGMRVTESQSAETVLNMVARKRVDAGVLVYPEAELQRLQGQVPGLVRWPALWASEPLHLLLHKRHEARVPAIHAVLAQMNRNGTAARHYQESLQQYKIAALPSNVVRR
jgi:polar amino acid transport system substrate-binding protein